MRETTDQDHIDLVNILLNINGKAMLSGYKHRIYKPLEENGWKTANFEVVCHTVLMSGKNAKLTNQKRIETIWISPNTLGPLPRLF